MMLNSRQVGMNNFCFVCKEPNKISMKVSDLRNINQQLLRIINLSKYDVSKVSNREIQNEFRPSVTRALSILKNDMPTAKCKYSMHCSKMDSNLLRRSFSEVCNTYEKIVYILLKTTNEEDFNKIKSSSLRLLQGHLPKFYTVLAREIRFNNKENL